MRFVVGTSAEVSLVPRYHRGTAGAAGITGAAVVGVFNMGEYSGNTQAG